MNTLEYAIVKISNMEKIKGLLTPKFGVEELGLSLVDNNFDVIIVSDNTPAKELVVLQRIFKGLDVRCVLLTRDTIHSPDHGTEFISMKKAELVLSRYLNPGEKVVLESAVA